MKGIILVENLDETRDWLENLLNRAFDTASITSVSNADKAFTLTAREREVLTLIAKGINRNEVARLLGISPHTVGGYTKDIYRKLNINTRAEATIEALRMGLATI